MKKSVFSRLAVIAAIAVTLCLSGCSQPQDSTIAALQGTWLDSSFGKSYYEITDSTIKNHGVTSTGIAYNSYEGEDLQVVTTGDNSGYIYIKYTVALNPDFTYSTTAPDVGKWYALSYKNLTSESISISGAYGTKSSTETLEEAKTEFTIENGYFSYYSECKKVE